MIRLKNETEDFILAITKNCETCIKQTHGKVQKTLEYKMNKPRVTSSFKPPIQIEGSWMLGLTVSELYKSIFKITEENNKFEFYTDTFDEFSLEELKDELAETLGISDIAQSHLQHELFGPRVFQAYKKLRSEKSSLDSYPILLMFYARSPIRDFESYLRSIAGLDEKDFHLILKLHFTFCHL